MAPKQNMSTGITDASGEVILDRLQREIDVLPTALARIAKYILENPEKVLRQSVAELCEFSGSGEASILRLCRLIGFSGFRDFKLTLAAELARRPSAVLTNGLNTDAGLTALRDSMVDAVQVSHERAQPDMLARVAQALLEARRIDIFGAGVSGIIAELLAYRLLRFGLTAQTFRDPRMAHEIATGLDSNCVAIALSGTGLTEETVQFVRFARSAGAKTIVITNRPSSPLAELADMALQAASLSGRAIGASISSAPGTIFVIESIIMSLARLKDEGAS